jgi:2-C-methyl-D-erythritol 4-phosphate cytidylyltransferase
MGPEARVLSRMAGEPVRVTAIVVGGGPGARLGAHSPKAFVPLAGVPLFIRAVRAVTAVPQVVAAVVVVPGGRVEQAERLLGEFGPWQIPVSVVEGGAQRQDSVRAGIEAAGEGDLLAIHDAARPFVDPASVSAAISLTEQHGAAIVGLPATDTIKQVGASERVQATLDRRRLWLAQTPQVFRADLIRAAHARARADGFIGTDDSMLVERIGAPVVMVRGNPENRKITTPDDLHWAEWLLSSGRAPR